MQRRRYLSSSVWFIIARIGLNVLSGHKKDLGPVCLQVITLNTLKLAQESLLLTCSKFKEYIENGQF